MKNVRLFISVLSVLSVVFCRADVVDVNQARANALQFINSGPRKSRARYTHRPSELRLMHTRINPIDKKPLFYLFNREQNGGFILASADDATKPVLAYSYEGKINPDSLPCCAKYWFDMYAQQIAQVRENPALIRHARAMDLQPTIAPLVHCCWSQGSSFANDSYNSLCPINPETGGRCVTGCVATAIGQIMYYHKWPERGTGSHSYNWNGKTLSANFGETTYDWCSMMRGEIDAPNSISTLLYHVGVAIDMNYGTDGSGASTSEATRLTDYFGYADNIQLMRRSKVSTSEWETTIYQELSNGRPVLYSGFPQQGDGHAFVCDGYENGYFHLNLGWGGIGNGFFDLDFIAEKDWFDFSYNQWICYGIAPPAGASAIETYMLDDVKYVLDKKINKAVCCGGNVTGEVSILPSVEINGRSYSVSTIESYAYSNCKGLTSITIPSSVTGIGVDAFTGCDNLTSVTLNSNDLVSQTMFLRQIFGSQVKEYIIGDNVTTIGEYAFEGCSNLISITIPENVTSIESMAFSDCNRLISVTLNSNAIVAKDLNNFDNMFGSQVKEYILGDQITKIGTANFCNCKNLSSITIPESVTSIGDIAFGDCSALTSITIPKSVKSIGNNAFSGCSSLTLVTINSNDLLSKTNYSSNLVKIFGPQVQEFILGDYITDIGDYAFYGYNNLKSITIPDAVTTIGNFAFNDCSSLAYIHIPEHITTIGNYAFSRCIGLTSIKIPAHVGNFGDKPFEGCDNLESVTINSNTIVSKDYPAWSSISTLFGEQVKEYVLGNEVTAIGDNAFRDCRNLTSITIPKSVSMIGESAFEECSCLSSINIPEGVTSIGGCAFFNCSNLGSVTIPISVRSIGDNSFYGCTSLTSISIPKGLETIGESTFGECSSLISVAIPESVTTIGWGAFRGCSSLSSVTIPEGITTIEDYTFAGCKKLSSIIIPPKVERIGWDAFAECGSLAEIFCYAVTPPSSLNEAFEGDNLNTVTLYVPFESLKKYQTTSPWNEFGTIRAIGMFKVSYLVDGETYQTEWLPEGETIIPATNPTKQGHTFSGWSEIPEKMPAHDVEVTGSFSINSYTLTYKVDGEEYKTSTVVFGAELTAETEPTKEGYTFSGWSEIPEKMPAHDVEVTGSYSINSYTLTYKVDGEEYKTSTVVYGAELTAETDPTKEGYTFCGWSEIPEKMPAHDVEVTGSFSINSYTLTYKVDGEEYKTSTIVYGAELTAETEPTKEGYTFCGWSEIPEKMPAHDVEVTGSFSVNKYTVTFKYGEEVLSTAAVNYGEEIPLPESLDSDRYTLVEWLDVPATMPAHDITIQASFTDGVSSIGMGQQTKEPQYYDVSGRKLTRPSKGITIVNGKKVLVK